jgi:hypothetical protein
MPPLVTAPRLLSTVTVPAAAAKTAKLPSWNGALTLPSPRVQLPLPVAFCQTPVPPCRTPSFWLPGPSQKSTGKPAAFTRLTWLFTEVCT